MSMLLIIMIHCFLGINNPEATRREIREWTRTNFGLRLLGRKPTNRLSARDGRSMKQVFIGKVMSTLTSFEPI